MASTHLPVAVIIEQRKQPRHDRPFGLCSVCATVLPKDFLWVVRVHLYEGGWQVEYCCTRQCADAGAASWAVSGGPIDG